MLLTPRANSNESEAPPRARATEREHPNGSRCKSKSPTKCVTRTNAPAACVHYVRCARRRSLAPCSGWLSTSPQRNNQRAKGYRKQGVVGKSAPAACRCGGRRQLIETSSHPRWALNALELGGPADAVSTKRWTLRGGWRLLQPAIGALPRRYRHASTRSAVGLLTITTLAQLLGRFRMPGRLVWTGGNARLV